MNELIELFGQRGYLLAICIGAIAGFVRGIAGGAGLVIITGLMMLGIPLEIAVFANKVGQVGYGFGALPQYLKTEFIQRKYVVPFSILSIFGGRIGANLLVSIDKDIIVPVIGVTLLCMIPLLIIRKNIGITGFLPTKKQSFGGFIVIFLAYIRGGAFGGGLGVVISYATLFLFGFTILQGKATGIIPSMIMNISAILAFIYLGVFDRTLGISIFLGMALGGILGSYVAIHKGNKRLKYLLILFIVVSSLKLLYPYAF